MANLQTENAAKSGGGRKTGWMPAVSMAWTVGRATSVLLKLTGVGPALAPVLGPVALPAVAAAAVLSFALAGCGFHLRGSDGQVSLPFKSVALEYPDTSVVGVDLRRNLRALGGADVLDERKGAQAVLEITGETKQKTVLSLNYQGRVREFALAYTLQFRVVDKDGRELLAPTEIALKRTIGFNESQALAKEAEESLLYRDMQNDLVQQVLRRLTALKPL